MKEKFIAYMKQHPSEAYFLAANRGGIDLDVMVIKTAWEALTDDDVSDLPSEDIQKAFGDIERAFVEAANEWRN